MNFEFLRNMKIAQPEEKPKVERTKIERNPTNGASLRLFRDGRIYPSAELVEKYNLQYASKTATIDEAGNGFDIFESRNWGQYDKDMPNVILIAPVSRKAGKVDLFGGTKWNPDGTPKANVLEQGILAFGDELLQMLANTYGIDTVEAAFTEDNYVDLIIAEDYPVKADDNIYTIPKTYSKGAKQGQLFNVRRENLNLYPLAIFNETQTATADEVLVEAAAPVASEIVLPEYQTIG